MTQWRKITTFFLSTDSLLCLFLKQDGKLGGEMHVKLIVPQTLSPIGFLYMFLKKVTMSKWREKQTKVICTMKPYCHFYFLLKN